VDNCSSKDQPPCDRLLGGSTTDTANVADPAVLGSDYCTYSFDYDCYTEGKPACCLDDTTECPEEQPACDVSGNTTLVGTSYCTYAPDYDCWEGGWPACCGSEDTECPEEQPACDASGNTTLTGTSYCTYAPDENCWEGGWPECCGSEDTECPEEQPACNVSGAFTRSFAMAFASILMVATGMLL